MKIRLAEQKHMGAVTSVFWETAQKKTFFSAEQETAYWYRYCGYYFSHAPQWFFVIEDMLGVCGYICAVDNTRVHKELYILAEHIALFDDAYAEFPAHLHINIAERSQNRGMGSQLMVKLEKELIQASVTGVHLVTSENSRNVRFYQKNGFVHCVKRYSSGVPLLFMGKKLLSV